MEQETEPLIEQAFSRMAKKAREWKPALFSREELIALCAAHIFAESFASKLGHAGSDRTWNAVKAAAEIVSQSVVYDEVCGIEAAKKVAKRTRAEGK
jgi:hypothetical protein